MTVPVALLRLSWPPKPLWQNRRYHWRAHSEAVAAYRQEAWVAALQQNIRRLNTDAPELEFDFYPPDSRMRDVHIKPATMKAAIDGIANAMGCDDAKFRCVWPQAWGEVTKGGCVLVMVTPPADTWQHIADAARAMVQGSIK